MFATVKNVPFSEKNIFINFLPVFLYILPTEISKSDSISGPKLGPKGSEKVHRTSKPNLEPPEPSVCLQKPNLEPTEPQKTERTSEPNQVRPNTSENYS